MNPRATSDGRSYISKYVCTVSSQRGAGFTSMIWLGLPLWFAWLLCVLGQLPGVQTHAFSGVGFIHSGLPIGVTGDL